MPQGCHIQHTQRTLSVPKARTGIWRAVSRESRGNGSRDQEDVLKNLVCNLSRTTFSIIKICNNTLLSSCHVAVGILNALDWRLYRKLSILVNTYCILNKWIINFYIIFSHVFRSLHRPGGGVSAGFSLWTNTQMHENVSLWVCLCIDVDSHICKLLIIYAHLWDNCVCRAGECASRISVGTHTHTETGQPLVTIWPQPKGKIPPLNHPSPTQPLYHIMNPNSVFGVRALRGSWPEVLRWRYGYFSCQSKCALIATEMPSSYPNSHDPIWRIHEEKNRVK